MTTRPLGRTPTLRVRLSAQTDFEALAGEAALLAHAFEFSRAGDAPRRAPLADMPAAAHFEIVLPAETVRVVALRLPAAKPALLRRALPGLIEDVVIGEAADCHAVVLPGLRDDGQRDVAIVDRRWMRLAQRMARLRRPKRVAVIAEPWLARAGSGAGGAFIAIEQDRGFLRHANGVLPFVLKTDEVSSGALPPELRLARAALGAGPVPIAGAPSGLAQRWADELGLPLQPVNWTWWNAAPLDSAWSLMTDEYVRGASTGAADLRAWAWPIGLAAACMVAAIVGLNLHWWSLARERDAVQARIEQTFRSAFPSETVIVDPIRQARRLVAASGPADELYVGITEALASAIDPASPSPGLKALEWRAQTLRVRLVPGIDAAKVAEALRTRGYDVVRDAAGADGAQPLVIRKRAPR